MDDILEKKKNVQKTIGRDKHFLDPTEVMNHTYDICELKKTIFLENKVVVSCN